MLSFTQLMKTALCAVFLFATAYVAASQNAPKTVKTPPAAGPKVTQIDIEGLKGILKPKGRPLMINFWATWCDPCREEFPDLVKLDSAFKGKIDFVTVSLDDPEDITTTVPKFLREQKAEMPAYLLKTPDESAAIALVSKDWSGALPLTVIFHANGDLMYTHAGKIKVDVVTSQLDRMLNPRLPPIEPKDL